MRITRLLVSLALTGALIGCGSDATDTGPFDPHAPEIRDPEISQPEIDFSAWLFDPERLNTVEITIDPADWDELRFQTRSFFGALDGECQTQPFEKPWTYFSATTKINGITVDNVGVRKKGFIGSLSAVKPSLKIKFGEFAPDQKFSGLKRMTLNNMRQDPTLINTCLGYGIFTDAGIVAPRCNFALVTVNGVELGVYAHVDSLRKDFVERNFVADGGNLWEGTISDFRENWTGPFELKTNRETMPTDVFDIEDALNAPDEQLLDALGAVIDLDKFYTFWATETLVGHWDGYSGNTNNFYFYRDPATGLVEFVPWGADALFRRRFTPYESLQAAGKLTQRLYANSEAQAAYLARVTEVLETIWEEPALVAETDRMATLVRPYIPVASLTQFDTEVGKTRDYLAGKREAVTTELLAGPPELIAGLRSDFCFDQVGDVTLSIDTRWNAGTSDLGSGTMTLSFPGITQSVVNINTLAGPFNGNKAAVFLSADLDDGSELLFAMTLPQGEVTPGGAATLDWVEATGELYITPPGGSQTLLSRLGNGDLNVTAGSLVDNEQFQMTVSADLHELNL